MKKRSRILSTLLVGTSLLTLVSCGNNDDGGESPLSDSFQQEQQLDDQGVYRAVLSPLNSSLAGETEGTAEIRIEGDDVIVKSSITGAPSGVKHLQHITTAAACPDASADANQDGAVDFAEMIPFTGPVLLPLDSNLSAQLDGIDYGPIANSAGSYYYRRSTSLSRLLADLQAPDPDPVDKIVKLPSGERLQLSGKVLVVHGVASNAAVPATAVGFGDLPASQYLPIACGQLVRVTSEGSSVEVEPEIVPVETEEEQAPEEASSETEVPEPVITNNGLVL